jgi:hypothetical protein
MNEERFFERLREDAQPLRFEPDQLMTTRIASGVRGRVSAQPNVAGVLARWFRPLAASMAAVALASLLGMVWLDRASAPEVDALASGSSPVEIAVAGDVYSVNP